MTKRQVAVIGGGIAGLTAALTAAGAGADVTVFEARSTPGGRARTERRASSALFNEGPHALYAGGALQHLVDELGVTLPGLRPATRGWGVYRGRLDRLPATAGDAIRSRLLGVRATAELGRRLASPQRMAATDTTGSMRDWIEREFHTDSARAMMGAVARTATYAADLDRIAASTAVPQLVSSVVDGVRYLDGGWTTIVEALRGAAEQRGARVVTDAKVTSVRARDGGAWEVEAHGDTTAFDAVILAGGGPAHASALLGGASAGLEQSALTARPCLLASLDLHLSRLPVPDRRFTISLDEPLYCSVHTPAAALAEHGDVLHVARYWRADDAPDLDVEVELHRFIDIVQPGWRDLVVDQRLGRRWVVAHDIPAPGTARRQPVSVDDLPGVFVAGDWVGDDGLLADASAASGRVAGRLAAG
jgi:phytoene dehydrogenase-like protein